MGSKQLGFGDYEQATAKKRTRRERFLAEMEKVVPWKTLIDLIEPYYPKTGTKGGRPPYPLATMLRIHLLQQWYDLSDPAMEDALIEVPTMRRFAGIDMISDWIPRLDAAVFVEVEKWASNPCCSSQAFIRAAETLSRLEWEMKTRAMTGDGSPWSSDTH